jgi:hypothetical protein
MRRQAGFRALAVAISSAVLFSFLEVALRALPVAEPTLGLDVNDRNPVARLAPHREFVFSKGWNFAIVARKRTNNYGFLSDEDYARDGPRPLIAAIGDSYVEAMQVANAEAFPALLARRLEGRGRVYPLALSGTALPSYLAYASYAADELAPDALIFSIVGNDFDESLLDYAQQPRNHYFVEGPDGKPALLRLDYSPSRLKRIARHSALVRYLLLNCQLTPQRIRERIDSLMGRGAYVANTSAIPDPGRLADSRRAVDAFFGLLPEAARLPQDRILFVVDGIRPELYDAAALERVQGSYVALMRGYFIERARAMGYEALDLQEVFRANHTRDGSRFEFATDYHWNSTGHRVVAETICGSAVFSRLFGSGSCADR